MFAVMGKMLWVDLSEGRCWEETVPEGVYQTYLSGMGLAAYTLYRSIPAGADPLGPENVLGFVSGLLTGTGSLMTGRWMVTGKSPLTGTWGDANCGGTLAPAIKHAGYDGIFVRGTSPQPVYLYVDHGRAELRAADELWGLDTRQTEDRLQVLFPGRPVSVACIGPAGEKCSLIAGISNDQGRMAARSGLGAVMGAKRLKALVVSGAYPIPTAQPEEMQRLTKRFLRWANFQPPFVNGQGARLLGTAMRWTPLSLRQDGMLYKFFLTKFGTVGLNQFSIETGDAPLGNWMGTNEDFPPDRSETVNPDRIREREQAKYHCYSCPLGCGGMTHFAGGQRETHKPEYETVLALGGLLFNRDLESIFEANEMLNRAGMDSISAGGTLAFALEAYERGWITREDTDGLELRWGDSTVILELLRRMIAREGIGDWLADGSRAAAERIGHGSGEAAVQAGGQELAMHDGRNDPGFALHAALDPTPGRHTVGAYLYYEMFQLWRKIPRLPAARGPLYPKGHKYGAGREKALQAAANSQFIQLLNGAGGCLFGALMGVHRMPLFEWLNAAAGWELDAEAYLRIGRNIQTARQAFNARENLPLKAPINPRALGLPPQTRGANRGRSVPLEELASLYWAEMGWDESSGKPPRAELAALGLEPEE